MQWKEVRAQFPALQRWTFLNTATFGQLPRRAVEAMERHLARRDEFACHDFLAWFEDHGALRSKLARLINSSPDDIAYALNAATAMAQVMNGLDWNEGDEIVTLAGEFPIQIYAPQARGVKLIQAPWPELLSHIGPRTRLVAVSLMSYVDGFLAPVEQIAEACRRVGALFYVDGTQGLGALRFDFSALQPDVLAVNTYKWMLTPNGVAFYAVHPRLRAQMRPLTVGWRSDRDWRNVANLHHGAPRFVESAEKYEGGMLPTLQLYALEAVVDMMLELGPEAIEARVLDLAAQSRVILERRGGQVAHPNSPIQAARFKDQDAPALAAALKDRGILASARHGRLRVSTHFYNDESDLAALDSALSSLL